MVQPESVSVAVAAMSDAASTGLAVVNSSAETIEAVVPVQCWK